MNKQGFYHINNITIQSQGQNSCHKYGGKQGGGASNTDVMFAAYKKLERGSQ